MSMKIECTEKELAGLIKAIQSPQVLSDEIESRLRAVEGYALNCRKDIINKTSNITSETDIKEAVHILGHIYGMFQYAQLQSIMNKSIPDAAMRHLLRKLHDIINLLERKVKEDERTSNIHECRRDKS